MTGRTPWVTYLWPGLPQLWWQGSWSALGVACVFAALVDLSLAAGLVWDELLPTGLRSLVWVAVAVFWVGSAGYSYRAERRKAAPAPLPALPSSSAPMSRFMWLKA